MITIGYSTKSIDPTFREYIEKSCGLKGVEVIPFENSGTHSLTEAYNIILEKSTNDIVVLCHDDIYFEKNNWGNKVLKHFKRNPDYGIIGVAGSINIPKSGIWWEDPSKMRGIVNHEHEGKKWESKYSSSLGNKVEEVVLVDGLFIVINKNKIKKNFNKDVKGFHLYDVDFCVRNFLENVKIGVIYDIRITHLSIGQTNVQWEENRKKLSERYKDKLPLQIIFNENTEFKKLILISENEFYENIKDIVDNNTTIIVEDKNLKNSHSFKKRNIKLLDITEIPGYLLGDGSQNININGKVTRTIKGEYYRVSNISFDYCVSYSESLFNLIKTLYPNIPKTVIGNMMSITHNSIIDKYKHYNSKELKGLIIKNLNTFKIKKDTIKIISGYTEKGGSTIALINLTNFLNENGIECTFYGPHKWHLNKCKSDLIKNFKIEPEDRIISHYLELPNRPEVKRIVLSSHEKWWFDVSKKNQYWDSVVFLHKEHQEYHKNYNGDFTIIPNLKENLKSNNKKELDLISGIIGTIEDRKQTHLSIMRALNDGCEKIYLFGSIGDENYYNSKVKPLVDGLRVINYGFIDNKQLMYDMIGRVYHSSKGEVACLVKDECYLTNTKFFGNEETNNEVSTLSNYEILNLWKKVLLID